MKTGLPLLGLAAALLLAGCASTNNVAVSNANAPMIAPVQSGSVSATALPPIGPNGEVQRPGPLTPLDPNNPYATGAGQPGQPGQTALPPVGSPTQTAAADGSFATLPAVGTLPNSSTMDLSTGVTVEKLPGRWTVVSGQEQCFLNITQTAKTGTGRYRASAPACALPGLSSVSSWALVGTQVQLFDEGGTLLAALILSGNRFIGTLSGGTGISMVR